MAIGRFTTVDPHAENYYSISPYAYVGNNPIKRIDPTGMIWEDPIEAENLKRNINNRQLNLSKSISENFARLFEGDLNDKELTKVINNINEDITRINNLGQAIEDIDRLGNDRDNVYAFSKISGGQHNVHKGDDNIIYIQTSSDAMSIHEVTHVRQSLTSGNGLRFDPSRRLYNAGKSERSQAQMEIEAYRMQYSYDKSFPGRTGGKGINGIDIHSVGNIRDNGKLVYPSINNYSRKVEKFIKNSKKK